MIENKLKTYFSRYSRYSPSPDFLRSSYARIIAMSQDVQRVTLGERIRETLTTSGALALASMLLLIVVGGISYVSRSSSGVIASSSSLSNAALVHEASQLTFQVQINEARFFDESAQKMALILDKLTTETAPQ